MCVCVCVCVCVEGGGEGGGGGGALYNVAVPKQCCLSFNNCDQQTRRCSVCSLCESKTSGRKQYCFVVI